LKGRGTLTFFIYDSPNEGEKGGRLIYKKGKEKKGSGRKNKIIEQKGLQGGLEDADNT